MRQRKASSSHGTIDQRLRLRPEALLLAGLLLVALWIGLAFLQELRFVHGLSAQASGLRQQNSVLAQQNAGYRRDIAASSNGAASEEEARQNGYSKPNEKVFVIGAPPSPPPGPHPVPKATARSSAPPAAGLLGAIEAWLRS